MSQRDFLPIRPGEILLEDFLKPMQLSQYALSKAIGVPPCRINENYVGEEKDYCRYSLTFRALL